MRNLPKIVSGIVLMGLGAVIFSAGIAGAVSAYPYAVGGTGTTTPSASTQAGRMLYIGPTGYQSVATTTLSAGGGITFTGTPGFLVGGTNLTISANGAGNIISTTSPISISQLSYFTGVTPTSLGGVTTSTPTVTSPITYSGTLGALVGGADGAFGCTTCATLTGGLLPLAQGGTNASLSGANQVVFMNSGNTALSLNSGLTFAASTGVLTATYASSTAQTATNIMATGILSVGTTTAPTLFSVGNALTNGGLYFTTTGLGIGTSSPQFRFSVTPVLATLASTFYINSSGTIVGYDSTNAWSGRISPTHSFVLVTATTTTWTASTTNSSYTPTLSMPFAGTLRQVRCTATSTQAFIGVNPFINTTATTPSYFVASTTVGIEKFTANNTFNAGDIIGANFGTTTTDINAKGVSCTFDVTETP